MNANKLAKSIIAENKDLVNGLSESSLEKVVKAVLVSIRKEVSNTSEATLKVQGLGVFKIKAITGKDDVKAKKRIQFKPGGSGKKAKSQDKAKPKEL